MKALDDSDDDDAEGDGDDEDFDGTLHQILANLRSRITATIRRLRLRLRSRDGYPRGWTCGRRRSICWYTSTQTLVRRHAQISCLGIFFSKDRREEVIEVEEDPETIVIPGQDGPVKLMTQSQWMKGCPEGGEQGFLFSLYNELSRDPCQCPNKCGYSVARNKGDFFPVLVSQLLGS